MERCQRFHPRCKETMEFAHGAGCPNMGISQSQWIRRSGRSLQAVVGGPAGIRTLCPSSSYLEEGDACQHFGDACCQTGGLTCAQLHNEGAGIICIKNPAIASNETVSRSLMEARLAMAGSIPPSAWTSSGARARRLAEADASGQLAVSLKDDNQQQDPASPDPKSELAIDVNAPPLNGKPVR